MSNISENYLYDQDNVRLRELSIGYRIPGVESIGLDSANLQLVGRNLFFFSKEAEDIDPEVMLGTSRRYSRYVSQSNADYEKCWT